MIPVRACHRAFVLAILLVGLSGCGIFGDKPDPELEPVELTKFEPTLEIRRLWTSSLGKESDFMRVALRPTSDGDRIYAASFDGRVYAIDPESGKAAWRTELKQDLTAGPAIGENSVAVMGADGLLIVLEADTGTERWRADVDGESLAQPLIDDGLVIVQTIDNRLRAVSVFDGSPRWTIQQTTPALTLRGSASPIAAGGNVVAGFDNGRLLAVEAESGDIAWESMISPPSGRSDLERLADIDGQLAVVGQDIYAAGYQGTVASVAAESGQVLWQQEISTYVGVAADWTNLYTTNENGEVIAMARRTGAENWRSDLLLRRWPTLPVPFHTTVVVGDFEGYLHFFSNVEGEIVARTRLGKQAISSAPLVVGDRLFVQSDSGTLAAYAVAEPRQKRRDRRRESETAGDGESAAEGL